MDGETGVGSFGKGRDATYLSISRNFDIALKIGTRNNSWETYCYYFVLKHAIHHRPVSETSKSHNTATMER